MSGAQGTLRRYNQNLPKGGLEMKIIGDSELRKELKNGSSDSHGYLFFGDEDYMKLNALKLARSSVASDASFAPFNDIRLDALEFTPSKLLDALMPPPMMAERKIVTVSGLDFTAMRQSDFGALLEVLGTLEEYDYNLLIINVPSGLIDEGYSASKPSAAITKLGEFLTPVRFDRVARSRLAGWAIKHFEHGGASSDEKTAAFFVDFCGGDMFKLANEAEKLCAYALASGRTTITIDDVRNVCVAETEFDSFAFTNAIMDGRNADSLEILEQLKLRRVDPIAIFGDISRTVCDILMVKRLIDDGMTSADIGAARIMNEYRAKIYARAARGVGYDALYRRMELLCETDMRLKSSGAGDYLAIELFICAA